MVTSPYEWKFLEWDNKPQTNEQILQIWVLSLYEGCLKIPWTSSFSQLSHVANELSFDNIKNEQFPIKQCKIF